MKKSLKEKVSLFVKTSNQPRPGSLEIPETAVCPLRALLNRAKIRRSVPGVLVHVSSLCLRIKRRAAVTCGSYLHHRPRRLPVVVVSGASDPEARKRGGRKMWQFGEWLSKMEEMCRRGVRARGVNGTHAPCAPATDAPSRRARAARPVRSGGGCSGTRRGGALETVRGGSEAQICSNHEIASALARPSLLIRLLEKKGKRFGRESSGRGCRARSLTDATSRRAYAARVPSLK